MKLAKHLFVLSAVLVSAIVVVPALAAEEEAHVLILNGLDPNLPAYLVTDSAMRANLANEAARRIVLYSETLDYRFPVASWEAELVALLTKKYSARRIDVVVTVTKPALDFFRRYGEQLWPGARVVFHGVQDPTVEAIPIPPGAAGVVGRDDLGGTIDIARRLQPTARRILFIGGLSIWDLEVERLVRRVAPIVAGTTAMEFLSDLPLPELRARVAAEPADSIIIYLTQYRDRDGRAYTPRDVLRAMSSVAAAPVYGLYETYVGYGVAAGSMEIYEDRGRLVGQLVREALAGTRYAPGNNVFTVGSRCVADARALRRWSLDAQRLPAGCDVRFADLSFWREYLWQIATVVAIIIAQALLISALLVQRRRRRVAELAVQTHRAEVAHASRLAVAGQLTASIAHEINQPLGAILSNVDAADLLIAAGKGQDEILREILADIRRDDVRASEVIRRLRALLAKHEIQQSRVDLNATVNEVAKLLRVEAERRGVTIEMRLAPWTTIVGDRVQIQQVLINLLLNAMDAVSDVGDDRRAIILEVEEAEHRIRITVRDRGRGIETEALPRVFDSFYSTKHAGMGLGLSIARTIVEAHGGRIWVESRAGDGAAFFVELPSIERAAEEACTEPAS